MISSENYKPEIVVNWRTLPQILCPVGKCQIKNTSGVNMKISFRKRWKTEREEHWLVQSVGAFSLIKGPINSLMGSWSCRRAENNKGLYVNGFSQSTTGPRLWSQICQILKFVKRAYNEIWKVKKVKSSEYTDKIQKINIIKESGKQERLLYLWKREQRIICEIVKHCLEAAVSQASPKHLSPLTRSAIKIQHISHLSATTAPPVSYLLII